MVLFMIPLWRDDSVDITTYDCTRHTANCLCNNAPWAVRTRTRVVITADAEQRQLPFDLLVTVGGKQTLPVAV
jgi:hypothetical protein